MKQKIFQFLFSAFLYWIVASFAGNFLEIPEKIISIAVFIPPMLGLMWGLPAAIGVYVGALFVIPELNNFFTAESGIADWLFYFVYGVGIEALVQPKRSVGNAVGSP